MYHPVLIKISGVMIVTFIIASLLTSILPGEVLKYEVRYGFIRAGTLTISVSRDTCQNQPAYRISMKLRSSPSFSKFYSINDEFVSCIDTGFTHSLMYVKKIRERKYSLDLAITYLPESGYVRYSNGKSYPVDHYVFDPLAAVFAMREKGLSMGETLQIPYHIYGITSAASVTPLKTKTIKLRWGKYRAFKIRPKLGKKGLFKGKTVLWIATKPPFVPLIIESSMPFGKLSATLTEYKIGRKDIIPNGRE